MIPLALRVSNFRSFKKPQEFVFPQTPGLYFMQGLNEVEPRLEGNAAGKTTIWEALTWCVFGKTSKGLKAADVNNWDAGKATRVEFDFVAPSGEECTLTRTWKPNSWTLHPIGLPQEVEDLDKAQRNAFLGWLGLEFSPWLHCILMAQNKPMFLDLDAPVKAALFSEVMGLDRWVDYAGKSSKAASTEDMDIRRLERRESEIKGELEALGNTDFKSSREDWEAKRATRIESIDSEYNQMEEYSYTKEDLAAAELAEAKAREVVRAILDPLKDLEADLKAREREAREVAIDLARAEQDERHAEDHLDALDGKEPCPTCGERLSDASLKASYRKASGKLNAAKAQATQLLKTLKAREDQVKADQAKVDEQVERLNEARKAQRKAEDTTADARRARLQEEKRFKALDEEYEELRAQVNPFDAMAQKAEHEMARLREERRDVQRELDAAREKHSIYSFWVRGFKEIRLHQIAEALTEFEIEVNSAVASLGLLEWELLFQVDRETAKGTLQRGFNTTVLSPHNERAVPWEAWSGGEGQRLRLAANMGLADLIRTRTGAALNLEVWDEPTQGLSPGGTTDLLESLAHRAQQEQRIIFVVDHRSYDFGGFTGNATIIKAPSGSRVRMSWV